MGNEKEHDSNNPSEPRQLTSAQVMSIVYYTSCSSCMLVANKVAIFHMPMPGVVFLVELVATVGFIFSAKAFGMIDVDEVSWSKSRLFIPYVLSFCNSLYCNGKALEKSNVETVIVFRACSPVFVSILEFMFLGRELPNLRSAFALAGVLLGAVGFVLADSEFKMAGISAYGWVTAYLMTLTFEMTYGKRILSQVKFRSIIWGSVLYTNILALLPMTGLAVLSGDFQKLDNFEPSRVGISWLALACAVGIGISWSGWNCRNQVSATFYALIGVACKLISVLMNVMLWDKHASPQGLAWLLVCLFCSSLYKQAPLRAAPTVSPADVERPPSDNSNILASSASSFLKVQDNTPKNQV